MPRGGDLDETPGGDSFLDIVANIVGILVLLVVVVGVRAGRDAARVEPEDAAERQAIVAETKDAIREALLRREDVVRLIEQAAVTQTESGLREQVRQELAQYVATLRAELDVERAKLSEADQAIYDTSNALAQARLEVDELARRQLALLGAADEAETEQIEVDPTPIVRQRVEDEVWVRLEGDRVVFLPIQELQAELDYQSDAIRSALLSSGPRNTTIERTVGPINGFVLRCVFESRRITTPDGAMLVAGLRVARLEPQGETPTEAIEDATSPGSRLFDRLSQVDPSRSVVTVVTYPDSFDVLPEFETRMRERGFRVAKALQREGRPITFSPNGQATMLQ